MTDRDRSIRVEGETVALILGAAAVVVLGSGWAYLTDGQAPYGDDNSAHFALMMHIADLWRSGVTDLWWNQSNLGLPLFMAYQPLPGLVSGTLAAPFTEVGPRLIVFKGTILGLWAAMPAAWYLGARWMGFDRVTALLFGLFTLAVSDLFDVGFGFTAATYGGLYTQIWGMFFLPLAIGAFRRYVIDRDLPLVVPVALFVAVSMSHLFCGMFAGVATVVWVLARGEDFGEHAGRMLHVYLPALALMAFWLGPLLGTRELVGGLPWKDQYYNGWPVVELFQHLLGGDVFDSGRIPWLTVLMVAGVVTVVDEESETAERWLLLLGGLSLVLFMGRTNFGDWYNLIPMHEHVNVMRYMNAVHLCGLLFAAKAGSRIFRWGERAIEGLEFISRERLVIAVCVIAVGGAYGFERFFALRSTYETFDQNDPSVEALVEHLASEPAERFAVDGELETGPHFYRDLIPALAGRAQLQSYALGYHATLSTYYADYIQYDSAAWARLFNIGEFVAREGYEEGPVAGLEKTFEKGPYRVFRSAAGEEIGYFDFVRTPTAVAGDYHEIRPGVRRLLVPGFERRSLPLLLGPTETSRAEGGPVLMDRRSGQRVAWDGADVSAWVEFLERYARGASIRSTVESSSRGPNWYRARVDAAGGDERLLLKVNYFPFWSATVDGEPTAIDHVAPNFMAVDVPEGDHVVRFEYRNPWWQKFGAVLLVLVLGSWGVVRWRMHRT